MKGQHRYKSNDGTIQLLYVDGNLKGVYVKTDGKITWDALRHDIEIYEDDLNKELFKEQLNEG